jgi:hypothetical protein
LSEGGRTGEEGGVVVGVVVMGGDALGGAISSERGSGITVTVGEELAF